MDYFEKIEKKPEEDLSWNIPEKKMGTVNVFGGSAGNFKTEIKIAEYLSEKYPIEKLNLVLPDVLKSQLLNLDNFLFYHYKFVQYLYYFLQESYLKFVQATILYAFYDLLYYQH